MNNKYFSDFDRGGVKINLQIKTPIWTGDIDSKSDTIQSTGIVGSLRWWTEALLRGMNEFACDPTGDSRCPDDEKYCSSCLIFGATGRRRLFRLEINGGRKISFPGNGAINVKPSGRSRGWFFGPAIVGGLKMEIIPLDEKFDENFVLVPLLVASKWGGIGAKTQLGYGVVEVASSSNADFDKFKKALEDLSRERKRQELNNLSLPNLKEMFFAKIQFKASNNWWEKVDGLIDKSGKNRFEKEIRKKVIEECLNNNFLPIAPVIKNWLRYGNGRQTWQSNNSTNGLENWLFGTSAKVCPQCYSKVRYKNINGRKIYECQDCNKQFEEAEVIERSASKLNISCAYVVGNNLWEVRVWGWIPSYPKIQGFQKDRFLDNLKSALNDGNFHALFGDQTSDHELVVWREYNSKRDTVKKEENFDDFVKSLL
ncbi:MAG TPA: type III-B CRISPR module RAMP protein Cmr1 [Pseudothermotoga sp.]